MAKIITIVHPNGYIGKLIGRNVMTIWKGNKEVLHTGHRNECIQTAEDLYLHLEEMPKFFEILFKDEEDK